MLFALNSGCLNSQACTLLGLSGGQRGKSQAYPWTIGRLPTLLIVVPDLVEVILVQLADETSEVAVFEMLGQDGFGESLILR